MGKVLCTLLLAFWLVAVASGQGSLLEMSQSLWMKLLAGGLAKVGILDPLRVPVVKVDQSEGDTMYRIILRNMEIVGLNDSTVESIHIARGRLKSNLSELEAGYVSYSDLRDLDAIRYRFHTLIKEPKAENETFEAIVSATSQDTKYTEAKSLRDRDSRVDRMPQYDPFMMKLQAEEMKLRKSQQTTQRPEQADPRYRGFSMEGARVHSESKDTQVLGRMRYAPEIRPVYPQKSSNPAALARGIESEEDVVECRGACQTRRIPDSSRMPERFRENSGQQQYSERRYEDVRESASNQYESRVRSPLDYAASNSPQARSRIQQQSQNTRTRVEDRPGYIDILYADGKNNGSMKRFGSSRVEANRETKVYGLEDIVKDLRINNRFIIHNFTEGESLLKRNDAIKTALEAQRIRDLLRYAKDYQEKEGYFEEGMQLVYHYGGDDFNGSKENSRETIRQKRAHTNEETEEDVMHVVLRIRVPTLTIKSNYELAGKVGSEILRGNGKLSGNITELLGDFTLELKKVDGNLMIVRAARSKLEAKDQKIDLQGMDEQGPVSSILKHGLMAAEAVAAMLADDLATKALSEKTADAMIYRMYKNAPFK